MPRGNGSKSAIQKRAPRALGVMDTAALEAAICLDPQRVVGLLCMQAGGRAAVVAANQALVAGGGTETTLFGAKDTVIGYYSQPDSEIDAVRGCFLLRDAPELVINALMCHDEKHGGKQPAPRGEHDISGDVVQRDADGALLVSTEDLVDDEDNLSSWYTNYFNDNIDGLADLVGEVIEEREEEEDEDENDFEKFNELVCTVVEHTREALSDFFEGGGVEAAIDKYSKSVVYNGKEPKDADVTKLPVFMRRPAMTLAHTTDTLL